MKAPDEVLGIVETDNVPVTTSVSCGVMGNSHPPSAGTFKPLAAETLVPILHYLASKDYPLLASVYPYFAYVREPERIKPEYALFLAGDMVVRDGPLQYRNLFDAMLDALYSALESVACGNVRVVVSETPGGHDFATVENAKTYINKVVKHVVSGADTPNEQMQIYLHTVFNEKMNPEGIGRHFGLYWPDLSEVEHVDFPN